MTIIKMVLHLSNTYKYTKKLGIFSYRVGTIVDKKKYWSSARHQITVNRLKLLHPYCACHTKKEMHSRGTTALIDLL